MSGYHMIEMRLAKQEFINFVKHYYKMIKAENEIGDLFLYFSKRL